MLANRKYQHPKAAQKEEALDVGRGLALVPEDGNSLKDGDSSYLELNSSSYISGIIELASLKLT